MTARERVLDALSLTLGESPEGLTAKQVSDESGVSYTSLYAVLDELIKRGEVKRRGARGAYRYSIGWIRPIPAPTVMLDDTPPNATPSSAASVQALLTEIELLNREVAKRREALKALEYVEA